MENWTSSKRASRRKIRKVKTTHKNGEEAERENYRPLTMLSIPCKLTESVACISLDKQLEATINQNQWAYKKGLSTESLLLYLTEHWKKYLDQGKIVGVILIDFRRAFDSIDHKILFEKMRNIGISENFLAWLKNYTYGRKQFVEINNKRSSARNVKYGVPQGSLFGPRLFSIYVNDLPASVSSAEVHIFADDATAFVVSDSVDEIVQKLNEASYLVNNWCSQNKLTVHAERSKAMLITTKKFIGPLLPLQMGGSTFTLQLQRRCCIDDRMSWQVQSEKVAKAMSSKICMLKRLKILTVTGIGRHLLQNNNPSSHLLYVCVGKLLRNYPLRNREAAYQSGQNYPQITKTR